MIMISSRAAAVAIVSLFLAGSAMAQTPAAAPAAAPAAKKAAKPRTPESLACSKEADDKNIHGKERKKFMSQCKKEAKAGK